MSGERRAAVPGWLLLLLATACYWRLGFAYGTGDHEELVPQLLRSLDPTLFSVDPYLVEEGQHFSVRVVFIGLLHGLSLLMPPIAAAFVLSVAAWTATSWAAYRLCVALVPPPAAALAVLAAYATAFWTPGGNELLFAALVPESLAWAPCLLAVEAVARGRPYVSAVWLGVAAWMQPLMGLQFGLLLGLVLLWRARDGDPWPALREAVGFGALVLLVGSPILVPSVLSQVNAAPVPDDGLSTYYVTAELRQPHHYLLFSQSAQTLVRFGVVVAAGLLGLLYLRRRGAVAHERFAVRLLVLIAALVVVYVASTEGAESLTVAKMQFFRLTVLAKLILLAWACGAAVSAVPPGVQARVGGWLRLPAAGWGLALGVAALTVAMAVLDVGRPGAMWLPRTHAQTDVYRVERWISAHTPRDALFLVPPSTTTFRSHALRSVVVNFKPTPYRDAAMHERLARLLAVAPTPLPERGGLAWATALDSAYHAHSPAGWAALAARFGADYALVQTSRTPHPPARAPVARAGDWAVYRLPQP